MEEREIRQRLQRIDTGMAGLMAVGHVWKHVDRINGIGAANKTQSPDMIRVYLETISPGDQSLKAIAKQEQILLNEETSSKKRLHAAQRLIEL